MLTFAPLRTPKPSAVSRPIAGKLSSIGSMQARRLVFYCGSQLIGVQVGTDNKTLNRCLLWIDTGPSNPMQARGHVECNSPHSTRSSITSELTKKHLVKGVGITLNQPNAQGSVTLLAHVAGQIECNWVVSGNANEWSDAR